MLIVERSGTICCLVQHFGAEEGVNCVEIHHEREVSVSRGGPHVVLMCLLSPSQDSY